VSGLLSDAPTEVQDSVSVMVSELSTNALLHASGGFEVAVDCSELTVTVSVSDRGDGTPVLQAPTFSEPHGRGLRIVAALSDEWGVSATSDGKAVWFRMNLQDSGSAPSTGGGAGSSTPAPTEPRRSTSAPLSSSSTNAESTQNDSARSRHRTSRTRSSRVDGLTIRVRSLRSPVSA